MAQTGFNGAATLSSRKSPAHPAYCVRIPKGFNGAATLSSRKYRGLAAAPAPTKSFNGAATLSSRK